MKVGECDFSSLFIPLTLGLPVSPFPPWLGHFKGKDYFEDACACVPVGMSHLLTLVEQREDFDLQSEATTTGVPARRRTM